MNHAKQATYCSLISDEIIRNQDGDEQKLYVMRSELTQVRDSETYRQDLSFVSFT